MKIAVIGTGGVGGYFGGRLAMAGNDVTFIARGEHLKAIQSNGLQVKSILGDFTVRNAGASENIRDAGRCDLVMLATKTWQIKDILNDIAEIIHPDSMVLPLQNGITTADQLAEVIDNNRIIGGLCRIISKIEAPGIINHFAITPSIVFGERGRINAERTSALKTVFNEAGIESILSEDIEAELWKKFIGICVGGLLAVTRTNYGELRSIPETRHMMIKVLHEVYLLSEKAGVSITPDFIDKTIAAIDTFPPDSTTSLSRDIWEGKPSELEYQNGTVVSLAKKYGTDTPMNKFIYQCLKPMELKARGALSQEV